MDSTPSKRRKTSATTSVPIDASQPPLSASRPAYMSPTKSSLARFNPNVLSKASEFGSRRESEGHRSSSPLKLNPTPLRGGQNTRLSASPTRAPSSSPSRQLRAEAGLSAPPRRRSQTPSAIPQLSATEVSQDVPMAEVSARDVARDGERSLLQEEKLAQAVRRSARWTRGNRLSLVRAEEEQGQDKEPDLPPTPEQLGREQRPEKPRGLQSSSPNGRVGSRRKEGFESSPLKPIGGTQLQQGMRDGHEGRERETGELIAEHVEDQNEEDPELTKRREILEQLSAQLESLREDVSASEKEVRRSQDHSQTTAASEARPDKLISLLTSSNPSNAPLLPLPKPPPLTNRLATFLPFSKRPNPKQKDVYKHDEADTTPILSHRPLALPNPLPHLRVFTPFTIASEDTLILPSTSQSDALLSQRDITLEASKSLLKIKLRLVSDTKSETVESISLQEISPWAKPELGSWIRKNLPSGDVSSIGWACSRYLDISRARSQCWVQCMKRWPHLLNRRSKGEITRNSLLEEDIADLDLDAGTLFTHNGRPSLLFSDGKACLLVSWRIEFDWIGEPKSAIWVEASFPKAWRRVDARGSLGKIGEAFDLFVERYGAETAVEGMVKIVFGNGTDG